MTDVRQPARAWTLEAREPVWRRGGGGPGQRPRGPWYLRHEVIITTTEDEGWDWMRAHREVVLTADDGVFPGSYVCDEVHTWSDNGRTITECVMGLVAGPDEEHA